MIRITQRRWTLSSRVEKGEEKKERRKKARAWLHTDGPDRFDSASVMPDPGWREKEGDIGPNLRVFSQSGGLPKE